MGLFDGIKGFFSTMNDVNPETGLSKVDKLGRFGAQLQDIDDGGQRANEYGALSEKRLGASQRAERNKQLMQLADSIGLSPKEKLLFLANPESFGGLLKEQLAPYSLAQGTRRYGPGGLEAENPQFQAFGDQYLQLDSSGVNPVFTRGPTISEGLEERGLQERIQARLIDDQIKRGQLGVSQGNLGLARQRFQRDQQGGGSGVGLPPGYIPR